MFGPPVVFASSGDLIADRRFVLAGDLAARGDPAAAADLLSQTLELVPGFAAGWFTLGLLRASTGDPEGAVAAWRAALAADPADRQGAGLHLQRLGAEALAGMPPAYVSSLFDQYAPGFDAALVGRLAYRAPELLRDAVIVVCAARGREPCFVHMLDLGCGTGLAGLAFRDRAVRLTGVDLSPGMVALARRRELYDRLEPVDLLDFLRGEADAPPPDLVVAADVFAYFADLAPICAAVAVRLAAGGLFAFTVETHGGDGVILAETLRYAHGEAHVRTALADAGFAVAHLASTSARNEKGQPVPGLVVVAQRRV